MSRTSTLLALVAAAALGLTISTAQAGPFQKHGHFGHKHFGQKHGHWNQHNHWRHRWPHYRPIYRTYRPLVAAPVAAVATAPLSCLSKEYTPQGAVLFKDRCTNEWAMNPPMPGAPQ